MTLLEQAGLSRRQVLEEYLEKHERRVSLYRAELDEIIRAERERLLTPTQRKVMAFLRERIVDGMPPTHQEICDRFGWKSRNAARCVLDVLEDKGLVEVMEGVSRGIRLM